MLTTITDCSNDYFMKNFMFPHSVATRPSGQKLPQHLGAAKRALALKGYTQRDAAQVLEVSETHLSLVLNGHRESASLLKRIHLLPENPHAKW